MVMSFAVRNDVTKKLKEQYAKDLENLSIEGLVREFLSYLDYTEESDSGNIFNPIVISSCRVLMTQPLNMVLNKLRERIQINDKGQGHSAGKERT